AFAPLPVPVGEQVDHRLARLPPGTVVPVIILGEAAEIKDTELTRDARPLGIRRGLAAIVEPGPDEAAGKEGAFSRDRPPLLAGRGPEGIFRVIGPHEMTRSIVLVDAARCHGAGRLGADDRKMWELPVEGVCLIGAVVEARDVHCVPSAGV